MAKTFSLRHTSRLAKRLLDCEHWAAGRLMIAGWLVVVMLSPGASAQNASGRSQNQQLKPMPVVPVVAEPVPEPSSPPTPPPPPTPEQLPPRAPQVSWDGKQLSISSENSTLAAILTAVRGHTHAVIEIPPGAGAERVAVELGPAPAREVLTSLLSGSNFDFVILASDTDEDAIQSVVLTPRGKADDTMMGAATGSAFSATGGVRRPPGYAESSRALALDSHRDPGSENSSSEPSAALEAGTQSQESVPESVEPVSAAVQPPSETIPQTTAPAVVPAEAATAAGSDTPSALAAAASPGSAADTSQSDPNSQMVRDLQHMYEQRRNIQMQQNQSNSPPN